MTNKRIDQLTAKTNIHNSDLLVIADSQDLDASSIPTTKKITFAELIAGITDEIYGYSYIPIEYAEDGSSAPDANELYQQTNGTARLRRFAGDSTQDVLIPWDVPEDCDGSIAIQFKVIGYITESTTPSAEGVAFTLEGYSIGDNDALNGTFGSVVTLTKTDMTYTEGDRFSTDWSSNVSITNLAAGETAQLKFTRDHDHASDTYVQKIGVYLLKIRYSKL